MLDICMIQQDLPNKWFACTSYLKKRHSARNICQKTRCPLRNGLWLSSFRGNRSETSNLLMIQRSKFAYCKREIYTIFGKSGVSTNLWFLLRTCQLSICSCISMLRSISSHGSSLFSRKPWVSFTHFSAVVLVSHVERLYLLPASRCL